MLWYRFKPSATTAFPVTWSCRLENPLEPSQPANMCCCFREHWHYAVKAFSRKIFGSSFSKYHLLFLFFSSGLPGQRKLHFQLSLYIDDFCAAQMKTSNLVFEDGAPVQKGVRKTKRAAAAIKAFGKATFCAHGPSFLLSCVVRPEETLTTSPGTLSQHKAIFYELKISKLTTSYTCRYIGNEHRWCFVCSLFSATNFAWIPPVPF